MRSPLCLAPVLLRCLMLCCLCVLSPALRAQVGSRNASQTIPLQPLANHLLTVHATLGGQEGTFLFDTGGGISFVTPGFAARIGCKPWGQISGFRMTGERIDMPHCDGVSARFGAYQSAPVTVGIFDLATLGVPDMSHLDGSLALDLFAAQAIRFSYSRHEIRVLTPGALATLTAGLSSAPVHLVRDAEGLALTVNVPVPTAEGTAWFELDSGNSSSWVLVGKHLAGLFQLNPDGKAPEPVTLHLADGASYTGPARVLNLILDGNLGTSFLARYDVTLDLLHAKIWVTAAESAGQ